MHRALAILAVLALPLALRAEGVPEPPDVSASADPSVYTNEDMIVLGQQPVRVDVFQETPIQTEWVSEEEIRALPARDAAAVVEYLAGVRTSQRIQGQGAAVSIEGMPPEYTQILVDGQRFSGEIGGVGDLEDFSLENVDHIELLRGGQGARYGTDAAGGVVNLVTKGAPSSGYRVGGQAEGGTDRLGLGGATVAGRLGSVGLSLSGEYARIDGFDEPDDEDIVLAAPGGDDSSERQNFLYGKWDTTLGDQLTLRGNVLWRVEHDDLVFVDEGSVDSDHAKLTDTNWRANGGLDWNPREDTRFSSDLTFYAVDTESQVGRDFDLFEDEVAADFYAEHDLDTGPFHHLLRAGSEIDWQRLNLNEGELPFETGSEQLTDRNIDETFLLPSVFLQTESALTSWLTLLAGVRGQFHSQFDARALPQVGVLLTPLDSLKLRASWGLNYRTPSLRDLHQPPTAQLGGAYFLAGNEDLEPEKATSIRAGFEWQAREWLTVAATGFYNDIDDNIRSVLKDEIVIGREFRVFEPEDLSDEAVAICEAQRLFFPDPEDWTPECAAFFAGEPITREVLITAPLFAKENLDSVRTWGAESQLRVHYGDWMRLWFDYTWLNTKVVDSNIDIDELPNEPEHSFGVRAQLIEPHYSTSLTTGFRWRGPVIPEGSGTGLLSFADASDETDPSYQLDFRLTQPLPFFDDTFRLHFDVINATDERREDSYAIRGRQFIVGISGEFGSAR